MQAAYKANDPASSTPAADERGVVAFFPDPEFGLVFPSAIMLVRYPNCYLPDGVHHRYFVSLDCSSGDLTDASLACLSSFFGFFS